MLWDTVFADSEDMKDGVCAYFFRAVKSDCNGNGFGSGERARIVTEKEIGNG